ncbi:MAG TPA: HWE histidine kinase domain-containing protein [Allosphingosinicella sp.]
MPDLRAFLDGGGAMGERVRTHDWAATALGPIHDWPQSLRSALSICLRSPSATAICWGPELLFLYNDAWSAYLGERNEWALGQPAAAVMADIWPALEPQFRTATEAAQAVNVIDALLARNLSGATFDSWWSYSLLPVASEDGTVGGVLAQAWETTEAVLRAEHDALLLELGDALRVLADPHEILLDGLERIGRALKAGRVGYGEVDEAGDAISILACIGALPDISGHYEISRAGGSFHQALKSGRTIRIDDVDVDADMAEGTLARRYQSLGIGAALVVPLTDSAGYGAMLFAHEEQPRRWSDGEEKLLRDASRLLWREISRGRAEWAQRRSEERYRRIFEQASDLIVTATLDQLLTDVNPAAAAAIGLPREEIIGRTMHDFLTEQSREQARAKLMEKIEAGGTTSHEMEVVSSDGRLLQWEVNSTLTLDESGRPVGLHAIARDVTERRKAQERQALLVNELNHRVKNTLALVQGLALQSFRDGRDPAEARTAFQHRLAALAAAHDLLTRESWEGATLRGLAEGALGHLIGQERRVEISGPDVTLGPKAAVSLVMALHELSTNASKYGALSVPGGRVTVAWTLDGDRLRLEWREQGGPPVAAPGRRGFGLRMIERALAADLGGGVAMEFEPTGLICRIEASLAEAAPRGRDG